MKAQIVSFHCTVKNKFGKVISSTFNHEILTGGQNLQADQLVALSKGLENLKAGEKRRITLDASQAYGRELILSCESFLAQPKDAR